MTAATALKTSFLQGEHLHVPLKLAHSRLPGHLSCRFQAPSATPSLCLDGTLHRNERVSRTRTRRFKCQSSLMHTSSSCTTTIYAPTSTITTISTPTTTTNISTPTSTITTTISAPTSSNTTTTYHDTHTEPPTPTFRRQPQHDEVGVQELTVYEVNERDRNSPALLFSSKLSVDWYKRLTNIANLGDFVTFSNKLFDGSLKKRLGITAGIISVIRYYPKEFGFLFEAVYSFYFGDFGHISVKGPYKTHADTILTVTGGSGIFNGVYGSVEIRNIEFPVVLFYTFKLYGIAQLPEEFKWKTVTPTEGVRPAPNASVPGVALRNFTD